MNYRTRSVVSLVTGIVSSVVLGIGACFFGCNYPAETDNPPLKPLVKITYPAGNEIFAVDSEITITVECDSAELSSRRAVSFMLSLSPDNGKKWSEPLNGIGYKLKNRILADYTIPDSVTVGGINISSRSILCKIKISAYDNTVINDVTDGNFTIE